MRDRSRAQIVSFSHARSPCSPRDLKEAARLTHLLAGLPLHPPRRKRSFSAPFRAPLCTTVPLGCSAAHRAGCGPSRRHARGRDEPSVAQERARRGIGEQISTTPETRKDRLPRGLVRPCLSTQVRLFTHRLRLFSKNASRQAFPTTTPINLCLPRVEKVWKIHRSRIYSAFLNCKQPSTGVEGSTIPPYPQPSQLLDFRYFFQLKYWNEGYSTLYIVSTRPLKRPFQPQRPNRTDEPASSSPYDLCKPLLY